MLTYGPLISGFEVPLVTVLHRKEQKRIYLLTLQAKQPALKEFQQTKKNVENV